MKATYNFIGIILFAVCLMTSCQGDTKSAQTEENADASETHDHSHDGHNHDHAAPAEQSAEKPYPRKSPPKEQLTEAQKSANRTSDIDQQLEEGKGAVSAEEWSKKKAAANRQDAQPDPALIGTKAVKTNLPSTCTLISPAKLGKIVGVDADVITVKDGSGRSNPHSQSCFFRWEHRGVPNSGVMIQVQDNPVPDEFPDWAKYYIQAKVHDGEQLPDGSGVYKYKTMDGIGDAGAYNYELNRFIWRVGNEYIFMIAFNLYATEAQQLKWAKEIGNEVMRNF